MRIARLTLKLGAIVALSSCETSRRPPAPEAPAASASPPPAPPPPAPLVSASASALETIAAREDVDACNAEVDRDVEVTSLPSWTELWKHLARKRPLPPGEKLPPRPPDEAGVLRELHVRPCPRACVVSWPPYDLPGVPAAYLVVAGPRGGLQLYGPAAENELTGQCNAGPPGATVNGLSPVVHASFTLETSSSTRVCRGDGGEVVLEAEGMEDCMSACVGRSWKEIDLFVGAGGGAVRVARQGRRDFGGKDQIAALTREGDTLLLRGKGCTRRIPLVDDAGR